MAVCKKDENFIMFYTGRKNKTRLHMNTNIKSYLTLPTEQELIQNIV